MAAKTRAVASGGSAIYARYSSELQNPRSIEDQVAELREAIVKRDGQGGVPLVFTDAETSGTVWDRPGLQALLGAVAAGRVTRIFVEDVSRISRDKGDAARFEKTLRFHGVGLVSVADGFELDGSASGGLIYGFKALLSDEYLRDLGKKTLRGLRGNAREGKATGGRAYGFRTGEGGKIEIVPAEAETVRRIFRLYSEGNGYASIAAELTAAGVEPPRRRAMPGWMHSCIREMLRNPKYVGQWSFGVREWRRHPETRRRVPVLRADGEVFRRECPELRIVNDLLWHAVQARLTEHAEAYKRAAGERTVLHGKTDHLLTGLLRCGVCGGTMQLSGGPTRYYRCVANRKRGACANRLSVREDVARDRIFGAISDTLWTPDALYRIRCQMAEQLGTVSQYLDRELRERRARLERAEKRIREMIDMQLDGDRSPTLAEMRRDLEAHAAIDRAAVAELQARASAPVRLPTQSGIELRIMDLDHLREAEGAAVAPAREQLRRYLKGGTIILTPEEGVYVARGELLALELFLPISNCLRVVAREGFEPSTFGL
jgi:site-specific DNA recombinase